MVQHDYIRQLTLYNWSKGFMISQASVLQQYAPTSRVTSPCATPQLTGSLLATNIFWQHSRVGRSCLSQNWWLAELQRAVSRADVGRLMVEWMRQTRELCWHAGTFKLLPWWFWQLDLSKLEFRHDSLLQASVPVYTAPLSPQLTPQSSCSLLARRTLAIPILGITRNYVTYGLLASSFWAMAQKYGPHIFLWSLTHSCFGPLAPWTASLRQTKLHGITGDEHSLLWMLFSPCLVGYTLIAYLWIWCNIITWRNIIIATFFPYILYLYTFWDSSISIRILVVAYQPLEVCLGLSDTACP